MKTNILISLRTIVVSLLLLEVTAWSSNYDISWYTIAGGGGTSSGGSYTLSGTMGQSSAGRMAGGSYSIEGGFWGLVAAIQTPGAPLLSIIRTNDTVIVSWPIPATGFVLVQTNQLTGVAGSWPQVPFPYVTNAWEIQVTLPATPGNQFFRLSKP